MGVQNDTITKNNMTRQPTGATTRVAPTDKFIQLNPPKNFFNSPNISLFIYQNKFHIIDK